MTYFASKMKLFQTKIRFLGHESFQGKTKPIQRSIEFFEKFPNEIKDKKQKTIAKIFRLFKLCFLLLQRFENHL